MELLHHMDALRELWVLQFLGRYFDWGFKQVMLDCLSGYPLLLQVWEASFLFILLTMPNFDSTPYQIWCRRIYDSGGKESRQLRRTV
jgi:hypothetical protein